MKDLTKVYIDLSKCTEEERKSLPQILVKNRQKYTPVFNDNLSASYTVHFHNTWKRWALSVGIPDDKTELTYPEFIKLFEGGVDYPGKRYQPLFDHLNQEHGLILHASEMQEIIRIVGGLNSKKNKTMETPKMTREETLQRIEDLQKELNQLKLTAYKYDNYVIMAIKIKGKETLQIHPIRQKENLCSNGWRVATDKDIEEFKNYI